MGSEKRVRVRVEDTDLSISMRASILTLFLTHCVRRAHPDKSVFGSHNSLSHSLLLFHLAVAQNPDGLTTIGRIKYD